MQMHTLELVRELEARAATIEDVVSAFQASTLDEFGELLLAMPSSQFPSLSRLLPSMPTDDIQQRWTGDTGEDLLRLSTYIVNTNVNFYERITGRSITDAKVLDFGCGWGRLLRLMLYYVSPDQLYGCDAWEGSLNLSRSSRIPVHLEPSDTLPSSLPFTDTTFDLIYAFSIFTHLSEAAVRACLDSFRNSLSPLGLCIITIRPKEFWEFTSHRRTPTEVQTLTEAHDVRGFAFSALQEQEHYGDASMSKAYLEREFPAWRIVKFGRTLIDPYQITVCLQPVV